MTCTRPFFASSWAGVAAAAALLAGCASMPGTGAPPAEPSGQATAATRAAGCAELGAQITKARQARDAAQQEQRDAWKVVVPFAVAARHARARHSAADAEQRLAEMEAEFGRRGCERQGS